VLQAPPAGAVAGRTELLLTLEELLDRLAQLVTPLHAGRPGARRQPRRLRRHAGLNAALTPAAPAAPAAL